MEANLLNKADVLKTLECLPEQFTVEELGNEFSELSYILKRLKDSEDGKVVSNEEIGRFIESGEIWKSHGLLKQR
ncbi:hypothetical protein EZS27_031778 [termite gut metagenome]|uniref:Uncharacterized protein n=1 Tax=termite gut metagenome TaxID=433724 RepID=A0A5J4Q9P4_9ZZZZ